MKRPRIGIYLTGKLNQSGPARYVRSILSGIDPDEFDVTVFCMPGGHIDGEFPVTFVPLADPVQASSPDKPLEKSNSCQVLSGVACGCNGRQRLSTIRLWAGFTRTAWRLSRIFRSHPVDLLHTNDTGCEESPLAARMAGVPRVLGTFHVDSTYDLAGVRSGFPHRALEVVSNHSLHRAIAVSEATKADWVRRTRLAESRVLTIHNGVDPEKFRRRLDRRSARAKLGLPPEGMLIGGVGRLDEAKGFFYLIEAMAELAPQFGNVMLVLAGEGPLREFLQARAAQLEISERVRFLGFVADIPNLLDALDVFALPSLCETLGYALLEAMSHELPAVVTATGGMPEVVVPGETGFLVPARDYCSLAARLRELLTSAELRERMGRAGRHRVMEKFLESTSVSSTLNLYRETLGAADSAAVLWGNYS